MLSLAERVAILESNGYTVSNGKVTDSNGNTIIEYDHSLDHEVFQEITEEEKIDVTSFTRQTST